MPDELARITASWREGWAQEFPGEEWPGLAEAQRRMRERAGFSGDRGAPYCAACGHANGCPGHPDEGPPSR